VSDLRCTNLARLVFKECVEITEIKVPAYTF